MKQQLLTPQRTYLLTQSLGVNPKDWLFGISYTIHESGDTCLIVFLRADRHNVVECIVELFTSVEHQQSVTIHSEMLSYESPEQLSRDVLQTLKTAVSRLSTLTNSLLNILDCPALSDLQPPTAKIG